MPVDDPISKLKAACDAAYTKNPGSCSNSVWDVIRAIVDPNQPYMKANDLIDWLAANWKEVDLDAGAELARKGVVVVGGLKATTNGHVIVIYPGANIDSGGYEYSYKGKPQTLRSHGKYPPAMSTSLGAWPGAMSDGDKTVWDPWGTDAAFAKVKFWTPKTAN